MPTTKRTNRKTGHILEIYRSKGSRMKFYYRLKGANGEVMMHSEVRENKKSCALRDVKRTVMALAANMEVVKVVDCTAFPPEVVLEKVAPVHATITKLEPSEEALKDLDFRQRLGYQ